MPGVAFMSWLGLAMAPATPRPIIARINQEVRTALALADVQKKLADGGNVATPSTPEEMRQKVVRDIARWSRVMAQAGIRTE